VILALLVVSMLAMDRLPRTAKRLREFRPGVLALTGIAHRCELELLAHITKFGERS
jgi:hypothetical protein